MFFILLIYSSLEYELNILTSTSKISFRKCYGLFSKRSNSLRTNQANSHEILIKPNSKLNENKKLRFVIQFENLKFTLAVLSG